MSRLRAHKSLIDKETEQRERRKNRNKVSSLGGARRVRL